MKTDKNGCSTCQLGKEQYESFTVRSKKYVQYNLDMNKLELKALQEARNLLQSFEGYKFYKLVASADNPDLMREYEQLSKEEHSKVAQAKYWLDAVLAEQK